MLQPTYEVSRVRSRALGGSTAPSSCTVEGVMKFDSDESPHCVYNEAVAVRLAQTIHAPIADGVLTASAAGHAFVSLALAALPERLPNLHWRLRDKIAAKYPDEVASLIAFDIFVGNNDRARNLKASTASPHLHLFRAFDQSHALLAAGSGGPQASVAALKSEAIITESHPFYGFADPADVLHWAKRISETSDRLVYECCVFGQAFRSVPLALQRRLAAALNARRKALPAIVRQHRHVITAPQREEG